MKDVVLESMYTEELYRLSPPATIVIDKPWNALTDSEKEQLQKITEALRQRINPALKLDAFQVIYQKEFNLNLLYPQPSKVIYFGSPIKGLNYFELIEVNSVKVVLAESLDALTKNEAGRQMLWKALQQLFAK
jgi:hypothetical protein